MFMATSLSPVTAAAFSVLAAVAEPASVQVLQSRARAGLSCLRQARQDTAAQTVRDITVLDVTEDMLLALLAFGPRQ
jgi:hypothetical protein